MRLLSFLSIFLGVLILIGLLPTMSAGSLRGLNQEIISKYTGVRTNYSQMQTFYKEAKSDLIRARERYKSSLNENDLKEVLDKGRVFLLKADEKIIGHLRIIEAYVEGEQTLSEGEKEEILSEIRSDISFLESKKEEIKNAETRKELLDISREFKKKWNEIQPSIKRIKGKIISSKLEFFIEKGERLSERVSEAIDNQKALGRDTSELERWLVEFENKLDLARENYEKARERYGEIENLRGADRLFREGNKFFQESKRYIRDSYSDLRIIIRELKSQEGNFNGS